MRKQIAFAFVLVSGIVLAAYTAELEQIYSKLVPTVCWSLAVSNEGVVSAVEVDGTDTTLTIRSATGALIKRWTPPRGKQFGYCAVDGSYVVAQYGDIVSLFGDEGREQLWAKSVEDVWFASVTLNASCERVVFANQPLATSSSLWCLDVQGDRLWSKQLPCLVTDTAITDSGHVVVAGEQYGLLLDKGEHAAYLFSPSGDRLWRFETISPVIDVDATPGAEHVIAGLDNGDMVFIDNNGRHLWTSEEAGGWVDLAPGASMVFASASRGGVTALGFDGSLLWHSADSRVWGDRDGLCVADDGRVTAVLGMPMIYTGNVVQILDSAGAVIYERVDGASAPRVAVSQNGLYVAVCFARSLTLFSVSQ